MSKKRNQELASILRMLADFVERCPDDELVPISRKAQSLLRQGAFDLEGKPPRPTRRPVSKEAPLEIADQLQRLSSREEGLELLKNAISNREGLERLARFLQLPVQRDDTVDKLRSKIVENAIGSRLRSNAIQGAGVPRK